MNKTEWKARFKKYYPKGARLLALHFNGFTHSVIYDAGTRTSPVLQDHYSGCMPEAPGPSRAVGFFNGHGHNQYQNNPKEIVFILPENR